MLSCLHILNAYLLTRRLIQAFFFLCLHSSENPGSLFQLTNLLCESRLLMTFTKFNEFSYATTGTLYMFSSHAQLALCLSVLFFLLGMRFTLKQKKFFAKCSSFMAASWD